MAVLKPVPSEARPSAPSALPLPATPPDTLRLGERLYREGILPSGEPVQAFVKGDLAVDGRMFPCANCHRRSGMGSVEGGIVTPPNSGSKLFQPSYYGREFTPEERQKLPEHFRAPQRRPAYTEKTLARAIRNGLDPTGRELNPAMPRYALSDADLAVLVSYLTSLSAEPSPGVSDSTLSFATVITSEVPAGDAAAMLAALDAFVEDWNSRAPAHAARAKNPETAQEADLSYRSLALSRWRLEGPPETWRRQLEAYYQKEPVFALLGGVSSGPWQPVHQFSEEHRIPCILPITDLPVISGTDWYTLYFTRGLYGEGEAAAASLSREPDLSPQRGVVQISAGGREGETLAAGFSAAWRSLGLKAPLERRLPGGAAAAGALAGELTGKDAPEYLLLWLGGEALPLLERSAQAERRPKQVYLSATLAGKELWKLSEPARDFASFTYPYRLPQDESMHPDYAKVWLRDRKVPMDDKRIATRMYTLMLLMNQAIPKMRRNFYRDNLMDQVDLSAIHGYPDFDRLSFGPGQRYASKETHVVTLSRGPSPTLIKKQ